MMSCADVPLTGCIFVDEEVGYCCLNAIVASAHVSYLLSLSFPQTKKKKKNLHTNLEKKDIYIFLS